MQEEKDKWGKCPAHNGSLAGCRNGAEREVRSKEVQVVLLTTSHPSRTGKENGRASSAHREAQSTQPPLLCEGTAVHSPPRRRSSSIQAGQNLRHTEGLGCSPSCPPGLLHLKRGTGTTGSGAQAAPLPPTYFFRPHLQTSEGLRRSHKSPLQGSCAGAANVHIPR